MADVDDGFGVNGRAGVRLVSWVAIEAQYEWIREIDLSVLAGIGFQRLDLEGGVLLNETRLDRIDEGGTALAGRVGGGLDIHLTGNVLLNVEVTAVLSDGETADPIPGSEDESVRDLDFLAAGVGLQYRFGEVRRTHRRASVRRGRGVEKGASSRGPRREPVASTRAPATRRTWLGAPSGQPCRSHGAGACRRACATTRRRSLRPPTPWRAPKAATSGPAASSRRR